jgi:hypothetical protein
MNIGNVNNRIQNNFADAANGPTNDPLNTPRMMRARAQYGYLPVRALVYK